MTESEKKLHSRLETLKEDVFLLREEVLNENFSDYHKDLISHYIRDIDLSMEAIRFVMSLNHS